MAKSKKNYGSSDVSSIYSPELSSVISRLVIPERIFMITASDFDDRIIKNTTNNWVFDYSGSRRYLNFKGDDISIILTKYFCFKYASVKFATQLPALLLHWQKTITYCKENGEFSLNALCIFLESEERDSNFFYSAGTWHVDYALYKTSPSVT